MQRNGDEDADHHHDSCLGSAEQGSRPERSYKPNDTAVGSVGLPIERRLRSRIEKFLAGYGLTRMGKAVALSWIQSIGSDTTGDFARVRGWLVGRLNAFGSLGERAKPCPSRAGISQWQKGCPEIIPGLRSKAFWSAEDFDVPWVMEFEEGFSCAREELLALRGRGGFQPYRAPRGRSRSGGALAANDGVGSHCHKGGDWNVFYLFLHDAVDFSENRSMCPRTVSLVEALPRHHEHAFFSALAPGTHVIKHNGPTNKKLRVHLPLLAPCGGLSRVRVGSETREVVAGQALVFDDSFEHEAWNDDDDEADTGDDDGNGEDDLSSLHAVPTEAIGENSESGRQRRPSRELGQGRHSCTLDEKKKWEAAEGSSRKKRAATRVTLIADVWHPDLSNREVRFLALLQKATLRLEKRLVHEAGARGKSSGPFQGTRAHHRNSTDEHHQNNTDAIGDAGNDRFLLLSPPASAPIPTNEHPNDNKETVPITPRRHHDGGTGAAAVGETPGETATTKVAAKIDARTAENQRAHNKPPDDPGGGGNHSRNIISGREAECFSEESTRGMRTVARGGVSDAGDAADNFLGVINRARELCCKESNIFGA